MWTWKLFMVVELFFYILIESEAYLCTCKKCVGCTGCSATACSKNGRFLSLLDYLEAYGKEVERQLAVTSPVIPCTVPNALCDYPHNKYCCDGATMTCGLGEQWSTCVSGSTLINNVITPIYTKLLCDFDFPCTGKGGNDCCGGLDLYNGEGPGTCSTAYCTSTPLVACNYVGNAASQTKVPDFDASVTVNGIMPTQVNNKYCGENNISNRNNGRCRASNLCCSPLGLCNVDAASCATKSISWVFMGGSINDWVQTGGAADSAIPCGHGTIGNGQCPTDDTTYGVTCCSDAGFCGSKFCNGASGNVYECDCVNGIPGSGTRGCTTCASCNEGYYLSSSNSNTCAPIVLGNFKCPSGTFVTSMDFWFDHGTGFITGIDFLHCSDESSVNVNKGQDTGAPASVARVSGFCGGRVSWVYKPFGTNNQLLTELTFAFCDGGTVTYGGPMSDHGEATYDFQSARQLIGLKAATCQNGTFNNVCFFTFTFTSVPIVAAPTAAPSSQPTGPFSLDGRCGKSHNGYICYEAYCCSSYGWCGGYYLTRDLWCGAGCQAAYSPNGCYTVCYCSNGIAATGSNCPHNKASKCASCNTGYSLSSDNTCAEITCYCSNGVAAKYPDCVYNGASKCASCNTGYYLSSDTTVCAGNVCICSHGYVAVGQDCPNNGTPKCASCYAGYHLSSDASCAGHTLVIRKADCSPGANILYLTEVTIIDAFNQVATLSSTYSSFFVASMCIDGSTSTGCAGSGVGGVDTLTITFTGTASSIVVTNRPSSSGTQWQIVGVTMTLDGSLIYTFPSPGTSVYTVTVPFSTPAPTPAPTASGSPTAVPTTAKPTFVPATANPTKTPKPSTVSPSTPKPSTTSPTKTPKPSTATPTTPMPATVKPSTVSPPTPKPSTPVPSTASPTKTPKPSTTNPTTVKPSTPVPTTVKPSTPAPTTGQDAPTPKPTFVPSTTSPTKTPKPITLGPATPLPSSTSPTKTPKPSTASPTTPKPSTASPTTPKPSTPVPTTVTPSTLAPTTGQDAPTMTPTAVPSSSPKPTFVPSTTSPTKTPKPSTVSPTTPMPSTVKPSTMSPTTPVPSTPSPTKTPKPSTANPTNVKPSTANPSTVQPSTLAATPAQVAASYVCSTGFVIDTITLRSGTVLNAISSYNCKDANGNFKTKTVGVGDSSAGTSVTVTGPFTSFSSGYAVSPDPVDAASGLSFVRTDGSKVPKSSLPPYGTAYTGLTTQSCSSGQVLYGFSLVTDSSGSMVGGNMTARCRDALTAAPSPAPT